MSNDILGRPIKGEIGHFTTPPPPQAPVEDFLAAVDAILAVPGVEAVRWEQYTPSWNDGDACEFGAHTPSVKLIGDDEETDEDEDYFDTDEDRGRFRTEYELFSYKDYESFERVWVKIGDIDVEKVFEALNDFERVLNSGRRDLILSEKFGDPAQITATTAGFQVDYTETPY